MAIDCSHLLSDIKHTGTLEPVVGLLLGLSGPQISPFGSFSPPQQQAAAFQQESPTPQIDNVSNQLVKPLAAKEPGMFMWNWLRPKAEQLLGFHGVGGQKNNNAYTVSICDMYVITLYGNINLIFCHIISNVCENKILRHL